MRLYKTSFLGLILLALTLISGGWAPSAKTKAPPPRDPRLAGSFRRPMRHGWIYVRLAGSASDLGFQHGYWLAPEINRMLTDFKATWPRSTHKSWAFYRHAVRVMWLPHIEPQYMRELRGIAQGLHARGYTQWDTIDVIILNGFEELPDYFVPWYNQHHHIQDANLPAIGNCSAFIATGSYTKDGKIVMGHNTWTGYYPGENWNIIFDIHPRHGYHILMDGFPGVITSDDDFGENSAGLMVTETTISSFVGWNPNGIPEFIRSRKALQYANSIDSYIRIMLHGNNGGYANDWLIGDAKTNQIARLELGLKYHEVWKTKNGMLVGSNFPSDPQVLKYECPGYNIHDLSSSPNARHVRWRQLRRQYKGKIDIAIAEKMESDHYDTWEHKIDPDERTLCGHVDLSPRGVKVWGWGPYYPGGTVSAKVTDTRLVNQMAFYAAMGHPCGIGFNAPAFFKAHPQYDYLKPYLKSMPSHRWTLFRASR